MKPIAFTCLAAAASLTAAAALANETGYDRPVQIELTFVDHIDSGMPEQDVFVMREPGAATVWRATKGDLDLTQPIFASAEAQWQDPFDPKAGGPFPKGAPLGMSLGAWLAAEGAGDYACVDGEGQIDIAFTGLAPNGVYTMWNYYMAMPPTDPFTGTYDVAFGGRDGAESMFTADANGDARFQRSFKPCLQLSGEHLAAGLAIALHSDGRSHGVKPGDAGLNSHVQMFVDLPPRSGL